MNCDSPFYHLNPVVKDSFGVVRPINGTEFYPAQACCPEDSNTPSVAKLLELKEIIEGKLLALESGDCDCVCNSGKFAPATDCCDPFGNFDVAPVDAACNWEQTVSPSFALMKTERYRGEYWTVNGPQSMSFASIGYADKIEAIFTARKKGDLGALELWMEDKFTHPLIRYETSNDFTNEVWNFHIETGANSPAINHSVLGLTLTVELEDNSVYYIRIANYADSLTLTDHEADVQIGWATVKAGFAADVDFDKTQIKHIFFSLVVSDYVAGSTDFLPSNKDSFLRLTTTNDTSEIQSRIPFVEPHIFGMSTGYDDSYNINPHRIVENIADLRYTEFVNHYCGMSHFYEKSYSSAVNGFQYATSGQLLNESAKRWHQIFAEQCAAYSLTPIFSVSFEVFSDAAILDWVQRDYQGNPGATGYTPPSHLISPCNPAAENWYSSVFKEFAQILLDAGHVPHLQIGEPWWWVSFDSSHTPCIYDEYTRAKYGQIAPQISSIDETLDEDQLAYVAFCRNELGDFILRTRAAIKNSFPTAQVSVLLFIPAIHSGNQRLLNFPILQYTYPNLDFFQTECYDWIIKGDFDLALEGFTVPLTTLLYPPDKIQYLAGFVPDQYYGDLIMEDYNFEVDGPRIWQGVLGVSEKGAAYGIAKQHIWAYNQVNLFGFVPDSKLCNFWLEHRLYLSQVSQDQEGLGIPVKTVI